MRLRMAALVVLVLLPLAAADHPLSIVLVDWASGSWVVGSPAALPASVSHVNEARFALDVPLCHRDVLVDILYSPTSTSAGAPGVGTVTLPHEVRASVWDGPHEVASKRIVAEGFGHLVGPLPEAGAYEIRLRLVTGADVDWSARVRGGLSQNEPGCMHVLE